MSFFSKGSDDSLIILVLHGISHVYLIYIHATVAKINWAVFQTKLKPNLMQHYFIKIIFFLSKLLLQCTNKQFTVNKK